VLWLLTACSDSLFHTLSSSDISEYLISTWGGNPKDERHLKVVTFSKWGTYRAARVSLSETLFHITSEYKWTKLGLAHLLVIHVNMLQNTNNIRHVWASHDFLWQSLCAGSTDTGLNKNSTVCVQYKILSEFGHQKTSSEFCVLYWDCTPIPVAARSKAWVCGRALAGIVGSRPAGSMDVCLLYSVCVVK
jgi:hypothetical protein